MISPQGKNYPRAKLLLLPALAAVFSILYSQGIIYPSQWDAMRTKLSRRYIDLLLEYRGKHFLQQNIMARKFNGRGDGATGSDMPDRAAITDSAMPIMPDGKSGKITFDDLNKENFGKAGTVTELPASPILEKSSHASMNAALMDRTTPVTRNYLPSPPAQHLGRMNGHSAVIAVPVYCGSRTEPRICLTFDSGEVKGDTYYYHRILDLLVCTNTPATFFLTGGFMNAYPGISKRIARTRLFEMGNHSRTHPDLTTRSDKELFNEINETQNIMYNVTGKRGRLFRAPFGKIDGRVAAAAARVGLRSIQWDVSAEDYKPAESAKDIAGRVLSGVKNGSIIIMHINGESGPTHEALGNIIRELKKRRFVFITVSTLLKQAAGG